MKLKAKESIQDRKLCYDKDFFDYVGDIMLPILLIVIILFLFTQLYLTLTEKPRLFPTTIISSLLIITFLLLKKVITNLLKIGNLQEIKTGQPAVINKDIAIEIGDLVGWTLLEEKEEYLIFRNPSRLLNPGENITVLLEQQSFLINSTAFPVGNGNSRFPLSLGANERNIWKFRQAYEKITAGKPVYYKKLI